MTGSVYLKFNAANGLCFVDTYRGRCGLVVWLCTLAHCCRDRGVLLQLGQEQVGHLPLGLFDDAMSNPPPDMPA